ncbi:MAG: FtsH protease activity modulator HflK [Lentisphaerae bacterium]|nr:FtsH protease activity modulator HflK [Lentisphaerota bacterium]
MAWNPQGGGPWGGGGGQGPWGRGSSGPRPPDFEDLIRRSQDRFKQFLPGGMGAGKGLVIAVIAVLAIWAGTGIYRVQPEEQGVELLFGKWQYTTGPGLHWWPPAPIGEVVTPKVTRVNRTEVGFRDAAPGQRGGGVRPVPQESLMLTGDENIIDVQAAVFWFVKDAGQFLFNLRNQDQTVKDASEAALREIVGKSEFEYARTQGRVEIERAAQDLIQGILDSYGAGIQVQQVQLQKIDPPGKVLDAFRDVQAARADKERAVNEATAYLNEVVQRAEGELQMIIKNAEGYKEQKIAIATGEAQRFLAVYEQYLQEKDVTTRRIYLETMRTIMAGMDKILIDSTVGGSGSGVVPYLPLDALTGRRSGSTGETSPSSSTTPSGGR